MQTLELCVETNVHNLTQVCFMTELLCKSGSSLASKLGHRLFGPRSVNIGKSGVEVGCAADIVGHFGPEGASTHSTGH